MTQQFELPAPSEQMRAFAPLIGTWKVTGGAEGTVRYEWLDGGHFLIQHVDLTQDGMHVVGIEVIGHLRPFGEEPSEHVHSRFYDNQGNTLDYVHKLEGRTLTIWAGEVGSPIRYVGELSEDGRRQTGEWDYAGQGGYTSTMTRID